MVDFNLWKNDITNRFPLYTSSHLTINDAFTAKAIVTIGGALVHTSSTHLSIYDAYQDLRLKLLDGDDTLLPESTTTQRDALTGLLPRTMIYNITVGRNETFDGTQWRNVSRRSTLPNLTASTSQSQGNGLLTADLSIFTTVANDDDTATLPPATPGIIRMIIHKGNKKLQLFPNTGDDLGEGVDQPILLAKENSFVFHCLDTTNWEIL